MLDSEGRGDATQCKVAVCLGLGLAHTDGLQLSMRCFKH